MLFLGRFVFRDFQKSALQKQGLPVQNGARREALGEACVFQRPLICTRRNTQSSFARRDELHHEISHDERLR